MAKYLDDFQKKRTRIISEMLDNPNELGIYPTGKCFEELDNLFKSLVKAECILFGSEFAYKSSIPESGFHVDYSKDGYQFETAQKYYDTKYIKK